LILISTRFVQASTFDDYPVALQAEINRFIRTLDACL